MTSLEFEKEQQRQKFAAVAFAMGFELETGLAAREFVQAVLRVSLSENGGAIDGRSRDSRKELLSPKQLRHWMTGVHQPTQRSLSALADRLSRLAVERKCAFRRAWFMQTADAIIADSSLSYDAFIRAYEGATRTRVTPFVRLPHAHKDEHTEKRYYHAYHLFRFDETRDDIILHGVMAIGPDEATAPGVPRVALLERRIFYRGFANPGKHSILAALRADGEGSDCAFQLERHSPSTNAFAGAFMVISKPGVVAASKCVFFRMRHKSLRADEPSQAFEEAQRSFQSTLPPEIRAGHDDFKILAAWLRNGKQTAPGFALGSNALWIAGRVLNESLGDYALKCYAAPARESGDASDVEIQHRAD